MSAIVEEPSAEDWMIVSNNLTKVINRLNVQLGCPVIPLLTEPEGIPTDKSLREYDEILPNASTRLRQMAIDQMLRRKRMEVLKKKYPVSMWISDKIVFPMIEWWCDRWGPGHKGINDE